MGLNINETYTMLEAIKAYDEPFTFLRDVFFTEQRYHLTEKAIVDVEAKGRKMAPLLAPYVRGSIDMRSAFSTYELTTPYIAPFRKTTQEDIRERKLGEQIFGGDTPEQRAKKQRARDLVDMDKEIIMTEEFMCAKVLMGASVDLDMCDERGNATGQKYAINYGFQNTVTLDNNARWTVSGTDPIADIEDAIETKILPNSAVTPTIAILDPDAAKAFLNNAKVANIVKLRAQSGNYGEPTYKGQGATFLGKFTKFGIEFYSYSNLVDQGSGTKTQLITKGTCIIAAPDLGRMNFGAITQLDSNGMDGDWVTYSEKRVPLYIKDVKNQIEETKLASRPLPSPKDIYSYAVISNICA